MTLTTQFSLFYTFGIVFHVAVIGKIQFEIDDHNKC